MMGGVVLLADFVSLGGLSLLVVCLSWWFVSLGGLSLSVVDYVRLLMFLSKIGCVACYGVR
jgi:hypothetical protein